MFDSQSDTRDRTIDRVLCGLGNDKAFLDDGDVIVDATDANPNGSCEIVIRINSAVQDTQA